MRAGITLAVLILLAAPALAQRGGGDRGGQPGGAPGGGGFQRGGGGGSDGSFNRLIASYGGSGDVLDYAKVPQANRDMYNMMIQRSGGPPMPTSGTITRADYAVAYAKRMEAMQANGGSFNRGGAPNGIPAPGAAPAAPQADKVLTDEEVARAMRRYDKNDDGRISLEEAQSSDRLRPYFSKYDTNNDGFIDMAELKVFETDRINKRLPDQVGNGAPPPGGMNAYPPGYGGYPQGGEYPRERQVVPPPEEEKAVALRFGKLPLKDLPSWWSELDTDKDGQIGMYEWRAAKKPMADFLAMDLNGDGYITAEEYLRYKKLQAQGSSDQTVSTSSSSDKPNTPATAGSRDGKDGRERGKGDRSPKEGKKDNGGNNPFRGKN